MPIWFEGENEVGCSLDQVCSALNTRGFLGSLYRMFGARSNGKAFLGAYKACLERTPDHA